MREDGLVPRVVQTAVVMLRRCADFREGEPWPAPGSFKDAGHQVLSVPRGKGFARRSPRKAKPRRTTEECLLRSARSADSLSRWPSVALPFSVTSV